MADQPPALSRPGITKIIKNPLSCRITGNYLPKKPVMKFTTCTYYGPATRLDPKFLGRLTSTAQSVFHKVVKIFIYPENKARN
jgi:hypothetical protein